MPYGLQVDGFNFTYGVYSVIEKDVLARTVVFNKLLHPDIKLWQTVFVPIGVRNTNLNELRPKVEETENTITMTPPTRGLSHLYIVLGR